MGAAARRCEGDNWADRQILILSACLSIQRSHASLQSARDYRGLCLLAREGLECTNILFRPIPPLHRFLCHLCSPLQRFCETPGTPFFGFEVYTPLFGRSWGTGGLAKSLQG